MICPRCGFGNPPDAERCGKCGAPFGGEATAATGVAVASRAAKSTGESSSLSSSLLPSGKVLGGRYEILGQLGEGGMGAVYKARDRELDRLVALKVIRQELAGRPEILQRFKQELILAREVTHKNVVRIFDLGEAEGIKFISMEFVEGRDLRSLLVKRGKFPAEEAASIVIQVARALDAAHAEKVIHRDLKPQNIMVSNQGRVTVMDFGIARSLETPGMTQTGVVVGTPEYMSPEQAKGEEADARADLFSLGIIFYELLTGKSPHVADTALALLLKRTQERARPPIDFDPAIPKYINDMVMKCLEIDRELRYASASEIVKDLEAHQIARPVGPQRLAGLLRRAAGKKKWMAAGASGIAALAIGLWLLLRPSAPVHRPGELKPVSVLVADFANSTGESLFDGAVEPTFSIALEGAAFISAYDRGQAHRIAAQQHWGSGALDENVARQVAQREGINVIVSGSVSREGGHYNISVKVLDAFTDRPIKLSETTAASKDSVLREVDRLAARVRTALGDTTSESEQLAQAETFTSGSLEAAHEYARAMSLQWAGQYDDAIQTFKNTIKLDPRMGRAYAGIGAIFFNRGEQLDGLQYYKQATANLDSMSEREKYRTRGAYYLIAREPENAKEQLEKLVEAFPSDSAGAANLALAYFYLRNMPKALEEGRRAIEINPRNVPQRNNLGLYAMYAGDFSTAIKEQKTVLELNPNFERAYVGLALSELAQGETQAANEAYSRLAGVSPLGASLAAAGLSDIALLHGQTDKAVAILEKGVAADLKNKASEGAARAWATLAEARLARGERHPALEAAEKAVATSPVDSVKFLAGRIELGAGHSDKALALATQLGNSIETDSQAYGKILRGETELEAGKPREALRLFEDAKKIADTWLGRFDTGRAHVALGNFIEADTELETCLKRRGEAAALFLDEVPTYRLLPPLYYYLGRAQEGLKSPAAADSYKSFLAFKEKGGGDPLVADARRRLSSNH